MSDENATTAVGGAIRVVVQLDPELGASLNRAWEIDIDPSNLRTGDEVAQLLNLCEEMVDALANDRDSFAIDSDQDGDDIPVTVDVAMSPAFQDLWSRGQLNQTEDQWDSRYDTELALRFDGSVDDMMETNMSRSAADRYEDWRLDWR